MRMRGMTKNDATSAAFCAQAYTLCTAFDFLCFPCYLVGMCRDSAATKYRKMVDEEAPLPFPSSPNFQNARPTAKRVVPVGSSRGLVSTNRAMFDTGRIMPTNYDPPATPAPIPLDLLQKMIEAATPPAPPAPAPPPAALEA